MGMSIATKRYPTDVDDTAWMLIEPLVQQKPGRGRKRTVTIREIVNALFYLDHTGYQWEMLPKESPDYRHVSYYYWKWIRDGTWDTLLNVARQIARTTAGHADEPTAAILIANRPKQQDSVKNKDLMAESVSEDKSDFLLSIPWVSSLPLW